MQCMESYFSKQLGCTLPWTLDSKQDNHGLNLCKGKDKFKEFREISRNTLKQGGIKDCSLPNCQQRSWKIRFKETKVKEKGHTGFWYIMPESTKVLFRKEIRLYTLLNFFAEVGGYLGLLLGESLLSYIIASSKWILILARKLKAKCKKVDDQEVKSSPA